VSLAFSTPSIEARLSGWDDYDLGGGPPRCQRGGIQPPLSRVIVIMTIIWYRCLRVPSTELWIRCWWYPTNAYSPAMYDIQIQQVILIGNVSGDHRILSMYAVRLPHREFRLSPMPTRTLQRRSSRKGYP